MAYTAINGKDNENQCIFVTNSSEGRKILQTCPMGSPCSVEAEVNFSTEYEIYKVRAVHRTGTPALDAKAKKDKETAEQRRWASVRPYSERTTDCVAGHIKGDVSDDPVQNVVEKFCAQESKALSAEYIRQFGPGGHYFYMNYLSDLPKLVEERRTKR